MELMQAVEHYATAIKLAERYGNDHGDMDAANNAWHECNKVAEEIKRLRTALEPFADIRYPENYFPDGAGFASRRNGGHVSYGDIKRAREVLATPNI